jgi:TPR repeat protein
VCKVSALSVTGMGAIKLASVGALILSAILFALGPSLAGAALDAVPDSAVPMSGGEEVADSVPLAERQYLLSQTLAGGNNSSDWAASFEGLLRAAHLGSPEAQHALAAAYSAGLYQGLRVPMDPGRSLAVDYFAALAGLPQAHMSTGYRYLKGLGVPQSCDKAVMHYEFAANHAAEQIQSRGYALRSVQVQLTNHIPWLSDDDNEAELIQYYDRMAAEGDVRSIHTLGKLYMQGSLHTDQDLEKAAKYFTMGAEASHAASTGQLGLMHSRGMGVPLDAEKAVVYLKQAKRQGDPTATLALGYCYHHGLGGLERNVTTALAMYQSIANKHEEAGFHTAELILMADSAHIIETVGGPELSGKKKEAEILSMAQQFYLTSANRGHVLSMHRLGHIGMLQKSAQACVIAQNFKTVAESGDWGHKSTVAHRKYNEGDMRGALQLFSELAFQGYESAQMNAAFILSKMYCPSKLEVSSENAGALSGDSAESSPLFLQALEACSAPGQFPAVRHGVFYEASQWRERDWGQAQQEARSYTAMHTAHDGGFATVPHEDAVECEKRALALYAHSAHQGTGTAYLKVGDFHYYGLGGLSRDKSEAARYYKIAADMKNTHALFNLGIMHQTGDGVLKDFHLAKRFYDEAAVYDLAAKTPSTLAVGLLQTQQYIYGFLGEGPASELLDELSSFVVAVDNQFGLGLLIFAARSQLLHIWLLINKSVLISSSTRFDTDAYTSATSIIDTAVSRAESYAHTLRHALRLSQIYGALEYLIADIRGGHEHADAIISSLLLILLIVIFFILLLYRSQRRQQRWEERVED